MHERAAEDVSRLLDRPGIRQVVELAEQVQSGETPVPDQQSALAGDPESQQE
jgi:hypothetical protein